MIRHTPQKMHSMKMTSFLVLALTLIILMPPITALAGYNSILSQASSIGKRSDRAIFISDVVRSTTAFKLPLFFRSSHDFWKYLLVGVGACGEAASTTTTLLNNLGFEARIISLPAEDHSFVEVKIDGDWKVLDPGYYPSEILTREERAKRRIAEFGAISYVVAYVNSSFEELTQYYVPTDIVIIRVTQEGEPVDNAQIYLSHRFMSRTWRLPDSNLAFNTDANGTVKLHLGAPTYNSRAEQYDAYFSIYVNDKDTGYNVTSSGTGKTHFFEIDMTK
jgi:hypothetical protein